MERHYLAEAAGFVRKANAALSPDRTTDAEARELLSRYAELEKLVVYGTTALSARLADPVHVARVTGTSVGAARRTLATAKQAEHSPALAAALRAGELSVDQANEIAKTEAVAPGSAGDLIDRVRGGAPLHVVRDDALKRRLDAQTTENRQERQHAARFLRHGVTDEGLMRLEAELEPHIGAPIVNRLEREARRLALGAHRDEPFERYLADALPSLLSGESGGSGHTDLVVLVSYEVPERGWTHVEDGEVCKIPGVGPIDPQVARRIAGDAFLSGVFYDGTDLRHMKRWTRGLPAAVKTALSLGEPPDFDGVRCVDCGNRLAIEWDHRDPLANGGATSVENNEPRCWRCHQRKTAADREAGRLDPRRRASANTRRLRAVANAPP